MPLVLHAYELSMAKENEFECTARVRARGGLLMAGQQVLY